MRRTLINLVFTVKRQVRAFAGNTMFACCLVFLAIVRREGSLIDLLCFPEFFSLIVLGRQRSTDVDRERF